MRYVHVACGALLGGLIALNAGKQELAKKWFSMNRRLCPEDNFGSRYYLATIALNNGKPKVKPLFRTPDAWGSLALAAEAARDEQFSVAQKHWSDAVIDTWAAIEVFSKKWPAARACVITSNHSAPAYFQEFMSRTAPFWEKYPGARQFFTKLANDPEVRDAVLLLHQHGSEGFVRSRRGESDSSGFMKRQAEQQRLVDMVQNAVASVQYK